MTEDKNTCWYSPNVVNEMNNFYDKHLNTTMMKHMAAFASLLELTDERGSKLLDLGCGTGMVSEWCRNYEYTGADLPHILGGSAMRNYPKHFYRAVDIVNDDLAWINEYQIVVLNAVIDIMENPIDVLKKVLDAGPKNIIIHRQEITDLGKTMVVKNDSYGGYTYHSIINRAEFYKLIDEYEYYAVRELNLCFTNWENGGTSFLLKKKKSWALDNMDHKLRKYIDFDNGIFFEAGANDGLRQSNTMYLEYYRNWKGILVEPIKENFDLLYFNRSGVNVMINAALTSAKGAGKFPMINSHDSHGLMSRVGNNLSAPSDELVFVDTITINEILEKNEIFQHINLMVLDMEGFETTALRGVDFDKYHIDYLLIEELVENEDVPNIIGQWYERVEKLSEHDWLYKRK